MPTSPTADLPDRINRIALELGFSQVGYSCTNIDEHQRHFLNWLDNGHHGEMDYMQRHADLRCHPDKLHDGTVTVISVRLDYLPPQAADSWSIIDDDSKAFVSRYALGRDYHKLMRRRLQKMANALAEEIGPFGYRAFVDSAPVLEKAFAQSAGLGWIGKHTNLLNREAGSWFFLGELYTDLPMPESTAAQINHCGSCQACIDICPTQAIVAPYQLDARRCISYLTIELRGSIPSELRPLIGNRIYGCDDCQLVCPWNKFAQVTTEPDFAIRHQLDHADLIDLFGWTEDEFLDRTAGSAIRRIGHECWLRNIAVAMGNARPNPGIVTALKSRTDHPSAMVREHIEWALSQQLAAV
jgi:epoxyqueuosine reductase